MTGVDDDTMTILTRDDEDPDPDPAAVKAIEDDAFFVLNICSISALYDSINGNDGCPR